MDGGWVTGGTTFVEGKKAEKKKGKKGERSEREGTQHFEHESENQGNVTNHGCYTRLNNVNKIHAAQSNTAA